MENVCLSFFNSQDHKTAKWKPVNSVDCEFVGHLCRTGQEQPDPAEAAAKLGFKFVSMCHTEEVGAENI